MTWWCPVNFSSKTPGAQRVTEARDKPLRHAHSCCKHHDEEVSSAKKENKNKKNEFNTRVQKLISYLLPKWRQNG